MKFMDVHLGHYLVDEKATVKEITTGRDPWGGEDIVFLHLADGSVLRGAPDAEIAVAPADAPEEG